MNSFLDTLKKFLEAVNTKPEILAAILFFMLIFLLLGIFIGKVIQMAGERNRIKKAKINALNKSRAVLGGMAGEQVAPYMPGFPCNPADARFVGKPVDFIAFPGAAEGKSIEEVLIIEVKTGSAGLSEREKQIKAAIKKGRVRYIEYRLP